MYITKNFYFILSLFLFIGILFFLFYNNILIIDSPFAKNNSIITPSIGKKEITLYYFNQDKWHTERQTILWSNSVARNAQHIINACLTLLNEEQIITRKVTLQSALLSTSNTLYISFDYNFFIKQDAIFKKWMVIEGILKTLSSNISTIQHVQFLINHQPLTDPHIDFSLSWPIQGFMHKA